jgi:hypothetical protein
MSVRRECLQGHHLLGHGHTVQGLGEDPGDTTSWAQITITFADATKFKQAGWGTVATFDPGNILALQFQIDGTTTQTGAVAYGFAVDDIAFF